MEAFIGSIIMFGGNFAPRGWALCNGQILSISQNTALFSILGTTYGGNGTTTFALPNLQGRIPMHEGTGPGLSGRVLGEAAGQESVTLLSTQLPTHTHAVACVDTQASNQARPGGNLPGPEAAAGANVWNNSKPDSVMAPSMIGVSGSNQPVPTEPPFLCVNFIIALEGIFPSRG